MRSHVEEVSNDGIAHQLISVTRLAEGRNLRRKLNEHI